jgi:hypothetical protein
MELPGDAREAVILLMHDVVKRRRYLASRGRRSEAYYWVFSTVSLLSGFVTAVLAGVLTEELLKDHTYMWKALLIVTPALGSISVAILMQFKVFHLWKLRETGKAKLTRIINEARIEYATAKSDDELRQIHRRLLTKFDTVKEEQRTGYFDERSSAAAVSVDSI